MPTLTLGSGSRLVETIIQDSLLSPGTIGGWTGPPISRFRQLKDSTVNQNIMHNGIATTTSTIYARRYHSLSPGTNPDCNSISNKHCYMRWNRCVMCSIWTTGNRKLQARCEIFKIPDHGSWSKIPVGWGKTQDRFGIPWKTWKLKTGFLCVWKVTTIHLALDCTLQKSLHEAPINQSSRVVETFKL